MEARGRRRMVALAAGCRALPPRQLRAAERQAAARGVSDPLPRWAEGDGAARQRDDARLCLCRAVGRAARARLNLLLHSTLSAQSLELHGPQFREPGADAA